MFELELCAVAMVVDSSVGGDLGLFGGVNLGSELVYEVKLVNGSVWF